jgi:structural maintenance of chromosome 2
VGAFVEQLEKETEEVAGTLQEAKAGAMKVRKELVIRIRTQRTFFLHRIIHPPTQSFIRSFVHCSQAAHAKAEKKLQEKRATLTRIDNELKELERVIEEKQGVSDADLQLKKIRA